MNDEFVPATELLPHTTQGVLKTTAYKPQPPPSPEQAQHIRKLVVRAVYGLCYCQKKATLQAIFHRVGDMIREMRSMGTWPYRTWQPGKRYVDRRVNEAADPRFYEDEPPKIVCVTAGVYSTNPELTQQ
jgi:hypothetical protein